VVAVARGVVVVWTGALVVVVSGALVVEVVASALGCLVFTLGVVAPRWRDRPLGNLAPEAPRTVEELTVAPAPLLAKEVTVAPELLLTAKELTSAASATATIIPPARARRRRIDGALKKSSRAACD
jgi:hypothetical protein